ncbi:hypothetical protein NDU88_003993 [Pleurodeles waltl]|uniref:Uncharacterized protein n=1 Tax=Pleurodeles waltl TaxID=8319 RepID=A0AAV7TRA2_PLEWA|nr:hypothetical protein NDU88_003993 [Pleurodeles waltl]
MGKARTVSQPFLPRVNVFTRLLRQPFSTPAAGPWGGLASSQARADVCTGRAAARGGSRCRPLILKHRGESARPHPTVLLKKKCP